MAVILKQSLFYCVVQIHKNIPLFFDEIAWSKIYIFDIEIEFELTLLTYKVFSCKDVRRKFLSVRL